MGGCGGFVVAILSVVVMSAASVDDCQFSYVESIPEGLSFPEGSPSHISTREVWLNLINNATKSLDIASFYWTLRDKDVPPGDNSSWMGEEVYATLLYKGMQSDAKIRIAQNKPSKINPAQDTADLVKAGAAEVRTLDFDKLLGAGVLHTKFWIADDRHVYIGSANMDYRSLSQVKELGMVAYDCPSLAQDLKKVFEVYWDLGGANSIPDHWPDSYATKYNRESPLRINLNGSAADVFISSSPPLFSPKGRADDGASIVRAIDEAKEYAYVAVMDFVPQILYGGPEKGKLWLDLESALRRATVERNVEVRLLVSEWQSTRPAMKAFVASLGTLGKFFKIETKKFVVPKLPSNRSVPFSRVNHNKYLVTDQQAFIGTSNWSGDYFINTAGVGLHIKQKEAVKELTAIFVRDWESQYTHEIYDEVEPKANYTMIQ